MSRAFLKESTLEEPEVRPKRSSPLPPGTRNLMTPAGRARLQAEFEALAKRRLEAAARAGAAEEEAKRELMLIDERLRPIQRSLETAEIVGPPPEGQREQVRFGASVTVREGGQTAVYRIVGVDEADPAKNEISHLSPLARALINAKAGERVCFKLAKKSTWIEVLAVRYES
jgi:transcription elongation factor GreB